jgi:stress-induced morphogen
VSDERVAKIEKLLTEAFQPSDLLVKDQSHLHAGHAGAQDGRGHFRLIYEALGTLMETDIHALRINASTPDAS